MPDETDSRNPCVPEPDGPRAVATASPRPPSALVSGSAAPMSHPEMVAWLRSIYRPGEVVELRALKVVDNPKYPPFTVAGYFDFDHFESLVESAWKLTRQAMGVYVTCNPLLPDLLARAANRVKGRVESTAVDQDVLRRRSLVIDLDPVRRPPDVSATEGEKDRVWDRACALKGELERRGWPAPALVDSGNGTYLYHLIDLPVEDEGLVEKGLKALAGRFSDDLVDLDVKVFNPARLIKLPGTQSRKGDSTATRPHRWSRVISRPDPWNPVPPELLVALANEAPVGRPSPKADGASSPGSSPPSDRAKAPALGKDRRVAAGPSSPEGRARAYVFAPGFPRSVEGDNGHGTLFRVACTLVDGFGLTEQQAMPIFADWNEAKADPPESRSQLDHKLADAIRKNSPPSLRLLNAERNGKPSRDREEPHPPVDVEVVVAKVTTFRLYSEVLADEAFLKDLARLDEDDLRGAEMVRATLKEKFPKDYRVKALKNSLKPFRTAPAKRDLGPEPGRPRVVVLTEIHVTVEEAVAALAGHPGVFQRTSSPPMLVEMVRVVNPPKCIRKAEGLPEIMPLPNARLLEELSRYAEFVREDEGEDGEVKVTPVEPPGHVVEMVAKRRHWPGIRPLEAVIECPTLLQDGTVLQTPGYDVGSGIFYIPHAEFPPIPEGPSLEDAKAAVTVILDVVKDFPFKDEDHRHAWLSGFLTPFARHAIAGPTPLFLGDANSSGAGKSMLCDVIAIAVTGRDMPRSTYTTNNEEMQKILLSVALGSYRFLFLDNVESGSKIGGAALDMALTSQTVRDRILGSSTMATVPFLATIYSTCNNVRTRSDILQRVVHWRLETPLARPDQRDDYKEKELLEHVRKIRPEMVVAALTVLRAYFVAGRPERKLKPTRFPAWSRVVRDAIHWATGRDPCKTRDELIADDENQAFGAAVVAGWEELCEHLHSPAVTAAEALKVFHGDLYDQDLVALRQTFQDHAKDGKPLTAGRIGYWLRSIKDTVFGDPGKKLVRSEDAHSKVSRWGVRDASIPTANPTQPTTTQQSGRPSDNCSAGDAGDAGDDLLYPTREKIYFSTDKCHSWG